MRVTLFLLLAAGLSAQENAIPLTQSQDLVKRALANLGSQKQGTLMKGQEPASVLANFRSPNQQVLVRGQEPASKVCSIPLLNVLPKIKGTMRTIVPQATEPNLPQLKMPAPPCDTK